MVDQFGGLLSGDVIVLRLPRLSPQSDFSTASTYYFVWKAHPGKPGRSTRAAWRRSRGRRDELWTHPDSVSRPDYRARAARKIEAGLLKLGRGLPDCIQNENEMAGMGDGFEQRNLLQNLEFALRNRVTSEQGLI